MIRSVLTQSVCLLLTSCAVQTSLNQPPPRVSPGCLRSSVDGEADKHDEFRSVVKVYLPGSGCSGTQIGRHLVITAQHCVAPEVNSDTWCRFNGPSGDDLGLPYPARQLYVAGDLAVVSVRAIFVPTKHSTCGFDFAVLVTSDQAASESSSIRLANNTLPGEAGTIVGFGISRNTVYGTRHFRDTEVLGVEAGIAAPGELYTTRGAYPGDSGGALLSRATGALIGITSKLHFAGEFSFDNPTGASIFTQSQQATAAVFAAANFAGDTVQEETAENCR